MKMVTKYTVQHSDYSAVKVYVCMYCMYVCMYVCIVCMYVCSMYVLYVCMYVYMYGIKVAWCTSIHSVQL